MVIRTAMPHDSATIAALITELGYPTSAESMTRRLAAILDRPGRTTLVAEIDGRIVGMAGGAAAHYYEDDEPLAQLVVLVVAAAVRRQGVGASLVQQVERWAASQGACALIVTSGAQRLETHGFYERRGFTRNGVRFRKRIQPGGR